MPLPKCPGCPGVKFHSRRLDVDGGLNPMTAVCCQSCGAVVGVFYPIEAEGRVAKLQQTVRLLGDALLSEIEALKKRLRR